MKIMKLTASTLNPVTVNTILSNNQKDLYYNIKHGSRGDKLHAYSIGMDKRLFKPLEKDSTLVLDGDVYTLLPIYTNEEHKKDRRGNFLYYISTDQVEDHKKDYIILWEIPNKFYTDVTYTTSGNVSELGKGIMGRSRNLVDYTSPAPVLEIYGPCVLKWTATKDKDKGIHYSQTIEFADDVWKIGPIEVKNDAEDTKDE